MLTENPQNANGRKSGRSILAIGGLAAALVLSAVWAAPESAARSRPHVKQHFTHKILPRLKRLFKAVQAPPSAPPAAAPPAAAAGAPAEDGVLFAQMTESRPLDVSRSGGQIGFVWGGNAPGAVGSKYYPVDRDLDRSHTAKWYADNAPDQIVYQCDRTTPASLYTYTWGSYSPLDISNPAVRRYILTRFIVPALDNGFKVIALDNVALRNSGKRCGIYRGGRWVQLYSGESIDPAFSAAMLDWVGWLASEIHARGGTLALNAKIDPRDLESTRKLIALGDYWLEEASNTVGCRARTADTLWRAKFDLARWAADRMGWINVEKTCASPSALDEDEAQWALGNYLLARGPRSYLSVVKDGESAGGIPVVLPRGLGAPVGPPLGPAVEVSGGWTRHFQHALVLVNPSSTEPMSYDLPDGGWSGFNGGAVEQRITVPPTAARILFGETSDNH